MRAGRRTSRRLRSFTLAWVLGALTLRLAAAQGTASDTVPPAVPREIVLQQQVLPYELESVNWRLDKTNASFLKEPKLNQPEVFRRVLQIGKDTNNAIALIWD